MARTKQTARASTGGRTCCYRVLRPDLDKLYKKFAAYDGGTLTKRQFTSFCTALKHKHVPEVRHVPCLLSWGVHPRKIAREHDDVHGRMQDQAHCAAVIAARRGFSSLLLRIIESHKVNVMDAKYSHLCADCLVAGKSQYYECTYAGHKRYLPVVLVAALGDDADFTLVKRLLALGQTVTDVGGACVSML